MSTLNLIHLKNAYFYQGQKGDVAGEVVVRQKPNLAWTKFCYIGRGYKNLMQLLCLVMELQQPKVAAICCPKFLRNCR